MRRKVAAITCAFAILATAGCGGSGNGDGSSNGSGSGDGSSNGSGNGNGEDDTTRPAGVPEAMTVAEYCADFEQNAIQPIISDVDEAMDSIAAAYDSADGYDDDLVQLESSFVELAEVLRAGADVVTDDSSFVDSLNVYADAWDDFGEILVEAIRSGGLRPDAQPTADELPDGFFEAEDAVTSRHDEVISYCD